MKYPDYASCILEMQGINKSFPGVTALDNVWLKLYRGEIHALIGENGAGKSTLMNILAGIYRYDKGHIILKGKPTEIKNEFHAQQLGIAMVHQELNNFPDMTVAENIFAGREPSNWGILSRYKMNDLVQKILNDFHLDIDPKRLMRKLSISEMQLVEIAKAVSCNADILIMDEPTSAISMRDAEFLFKILHSIRERGVSVIYISHKMDEVFRISDSITILRDGKLISTSLASQTNYDELIKKMVGREPNELFPLRSVVPGETVLNINHLSRGKAFKDISLSLRKGEVLGLAGLVGSGRTEIVESIFGFPPAEQGIIEVMGKQVEITSPRKAIGNGIALVPEDRKLSGLHLQASVLFNITLPTLKAFARKSGIIKQRKEKSSAVQISQQLNVRANNLKQAVENLSGGNQQKIVIAKWLLAQPSILLLDEPTRGIDISAKSEIYQLMNKLTEKGISILMVSSEMTELMGMCDRIIALKSGQISKEFNHSEFDQERILAAIMP